jgi:hypothetical protein
MQQQQPLPEQGSWQLPRAVAGPRVPLNPAAFQAALSPHHPQVGPLSRLLPYLLTVCFIITLLCSSAGF